MNDCIISKTVTLSSWWFFFCFFILFLLNNVIYRPPSFPRSANTSKMASEISVKANEGNDIKSMIITI